MVFRGFVTVLFLLLSGEFALSQEISHEVLVPAAKVVLKGNINYQQTIGEPIVDILRVDDKVLTQGFQQKRVQPKKVDVTGSNVKSYPNPVTDFLYVEVWGDVARELNFSILNFQGVMLFNTERNYPYPYFEVIEVPVASYKPGIYFLRVTSKDNVFYRTFKFEKM